MGSPDCPTRAYDKSKIFGDPQAFPIIHTHTDQHLGLIVTAKGLIQVVVLKQQADWCLLVLRKDVLD